MHLLTVFFLYFENSTHKTEPQMDLAVLLQHFLTQLNKKRLTDQSKQIWADHTRSLRKHCWVCMGGIKSENRF